MSTPTQIDRKLPPIVKARIVGNYSLHNKINCIDYMAELLGVSPPNRDDLDVSVEYSIAKCLEVIKSANLNAVLAPSEEHYQDGDVILCLPLDGWPHMAMYRKLNDRLRFLDSIIMGVTPNDDLRSDLPELIEQRPALAGCIPSSVIFKDGCEILGVYR
ncbi:TPA: hypothetical protein ACX6NV_002027 [Photobacterium damselae]